MAFSFNIDRGGDVLSSLKLSNRQLLGPTPTPTTTPTPTPTLTPTPTPTPPPGSYTLTSGTSYPVYGTGASSNVPPTGWTTQVNSNFDDANVGYTLPFTFYMAGTGYTAIYLGSNTYVTFGAGSNAYSSLGVNNPPYPKLMFGAADNSYQRVFYYQHPSNDYFAWRYEGNAGTSGTPGSPGIVAELRFFKPSLFSGNNYIELRIGAHNATGQLFRMDDGVSTTYWSSTIAANQSYVMVGNSNGTSWTLYTGYYISPNT